jgi:hypothetical protein
MEYCSNNNNKNIYKKEGKVTFIKIKTKTKHQQKITTKSFLNKLILFHFNISFLLVFLLLLSLLLLELIK